MKVMGIVYMQQWALFDINNGHRLKNECTDTFYRMCQHFETKGLALCIKSVSPLKKRRFERFGQKVRTLANRYPLMG